MAANFSNPYRQSTRKLIYEQLIDTVDMLMEMERWSKLTDKELVLIRMNLSLVRKKIATKRELHNNAHLREVPNAWRQKKESLSAGNQLLY